MGGGAVIAAVVAARKREMDKVLDGYRVAGATRYDLARSLYDLGLAPNTIVDELRVAGVLKPGQIPDSWYLDERAYVEMRDVRFNRKKTTARILLIVAAILAIVGLLVAVRVSGLII